MSRKATHLELVTARVPGTTVNASDLVSRKTKERLELRANSRELVQAGRAQSLPSRVRASSKKASPPHERVPMDEDQAVFGGCCLSVHGEHRTMTVIEVGSAWRSRQNIRLTLRVEC